MYECTCKMVGFLKLKKMPTFDQNQFLTCYLIFNFRPIYFSYFQKFIAQSISHNVKKQVEQNTPYDLDHIRSQGVKYDDEIRKLTLNHRNLS